MNISITGYPLPSAVTIPDARPDDHIHGHGWLLTPEQVDLILSAWKTAPARGSDVVREWEYFEVGLYVTALHMDEEVTITGWESATGSDGDDVYSTTDWPFDFDIVPAP